MTKARLAAALGISSRSLHNYETGICAPDGRLLARMAAHLGFPEGFFFLDEDVSRIEEGAVSFRRLSKTSALVKEAAFACGATAFRLNQWMQERFRLPQEDVPDLSDLQPEEAAASLRRMWGLGNAPIANMVHLLESKGIRVFSLPEEIRNVDAFCTWLDGTPFVFLHTGKSAERSRFDAAHELGHLVRDVCTMRHGNKDDRATKEMEVQADRFASAFLMPMDSVMANRPPACTSGYLIKLKKHWGVSLAALAYRLRDLELVSEWGYRNLCVEIAKNGWRKNEPQPMDRETSQLLAKVFDILRSKGKGVAEVAGSLCLDVNEVQALTFHLAQTADSMHKASPKLRLVWDSRTGYIPHKMTRLGNF